MKNYLQLLESLVEESQNPLSHRLDRTKTGTTALFAKHLEFDLSIGFPIVTTKKVHFHSVVVELLWFLKGLSNIEYLHRYKVSIWDEWADSNGDLGPIYGCQWRNWNNEGIDQIENLIKGLQDDPFGRRHIISAWNVSALDKMKLPPCHILCQFFVKDNCLSAQLYQRSCDVFLGLPFNIASYSLLIHIVAQKCGYQVGTLHWVGGDVHLYDNHLDQARIQINRTPYSLPSLYIAVSRTEVWEYNPEDFELKEYKHHSPLKAQVAV